MKTLTLIAALTCAAGGAACGSSGGGCKDFVGTYSGTISGNGSFNGTLTLIVSLVTEESESADLTGTWNGQNGYFGDINRADLKCSDGSVKYDFGVALKGPTSIVCPPPCPPTSSEGGCYCNGATLGEFAGTMTPTGGTGTWKGDSGAAQTIGATGGGTWSVSR